MAVHSNLSTILGQKRIKMAELARMTGLSKLTISGLYHDTTTKVGFSTLYKICTALDCTIADILILAQNENISQNKNRSV